MLVDLTNDLKVGDQIEVILHLKNSEDMKVAVPVRETAVPEEDHPSGDH
jgi:copper(I)-binding protein